MIIGNYYSILPTAPRWIARQHVGKVFVSLNSYLRMSGWLLSLATVTVINACSSCRSCSAGSSLSDIPGIRSKREPVACEHRTTHAGEAQLFTSSRQNHTWTSSRRHLAPGSPTSPACCPGSVAPSIANRSFARCWSGLKPS